MARRAVPSDPDDDEDPQVATAASEKDGRPVRKSALGARRAWEDFMPKTRAPKKVEERKEKNRGAASAKKAASTLTSEYPPPNIDLNVSDDGSPAPHPRGSKKGRGTTSAIGRVSSSDAEDDALVKSQTPRSSQAKGKAKATSSQSAEEGSSSSGEGEVEDDDELLSGSSGLGELEEKDPSALQAKFESEAPAWIDGAESPLDDGDIDPFLPSSPVDSPTRTNRDADIGPTPFKSQSKRPRVESSDGSESEEHVHPKSSPVKKRTRTRDAMSKAVKGKSRESESDDGGVDTDAGAMGMAEHCAEDSVEEHKRADKREDGRKRKLEEERERKRKHEEQREEARERKHEERRADRAKERARERERQRMELQEYYEREKKRERRERQERKQDEERQRKKERERERERERDKARERELELDLAMEREYEREHDAVQKQLRGNYDKPKKPHARKEQNYDEMEDEPEGRHDKRRAKAKTDPRAGRIAGPSRSSASGIARSRTQTAAPSSKGCNQDGLKASKRKRGKQDEEIKFVSDNGSSGLDEEPPSRKRRQDVVPPSSDENDTSVTLVWFGNSRPNLTNQPPRVRQVANLAISDCELSVCTVNAFPDDPDGDGSFTRDVLIKHAKALGYKAMTRMLKDRKDNTYWKKFSTIPSQRVFLLRGKVKSKCEGAVRAAYNLTVGDAEKVAWLQKDLAYIYPHSYENRTVNGKEGFKPAIFENILIASFFSKRQSFGYRISKHFKSSHPDKPDEKEIPAPMLALVSTAIFAAIDDFKHVRYDAANFEVNPNLHVYRRNMTFLDHIKDKNIDAFHALMHGLFKRVTGSADSGSNDLGHGMGYLDVDGMGRS